MICAYCRDVLPGEGEQALACAGCAALLHRACARVHGRCVTLGCPDPGFVRASPSARRRALTLRPPLGLRLRRSARTGLEVALAPLEDAPLALLGAGGVVALALLAL